MKRTAIAFGLVFLAGVGSSQIVGRIVKTLGVGAAIKQFGPQINRGLNDLTKHRDSAKVATKVVPIVTLGVNSRQSIGAAQVMGPPDRIARVGSVAQLDQDLLGREIKIRGLIPIEGNDPSSLVRVSGVGVSGTVDLRL